VVPFSEKGEDIRRKAFELASDSAVTPELFQPIAKSFLARNPSQSKDLQHKFQLAPAEPLDIELLARLNTGTKWKKLKPNPDERDLHLKWLWAHSLQTGNWPQAAFFLQELQEKSVVKGSLSHLLKMVSLEAAGAHSEAMLE